MLCVYFRSACVSVPFCEYVWTVYSLEDAGQGAPGHEPLRTGSSVQPACLEGDCLGQPPSSSH